MKRHHASIFTPCCLVPLLLLQGCNPRDPTVEAPTERRAEQAIRVQGITEVDGQTLIELPIGSAGGIDVTSFFRVYDPQDQGVIKCMLKVKEVLGDRHCVALIIGGLFDLENPVRIGDPVREVDDLALIGGGHAIEREARLESYRLERADAETRSAFDALRENYQRRLREIVEGRDQALAELQAAHEQQQQGEHREQERLLAQKDLERRSDLAALRSSMLAESSAEVQRTRREGKARIIELERERDELQAQTAALVSEQGRLLERIGKLVEHEGLLRQQHETALRAEVESREILAARLAQIERNLAPAEVTDTTLTSDPRRSETILERLDRITAERDTIKRNHDLLHGQVEQLQQQLQLAQQRLELTGRELATLRAHQGREGELSARVTTLEQELATTREHLDAASLARLESERQYYELILRVLRLPEAQADQLRFLKQRLRDLSPQKPRQETTP